MAEWIMSANANKYNHQLAFKEQGFVFWRQIRRFQKGDVVYIYCTKPIGQIQYFAEVQETDIPYERTETDNKYYTDLSQKKSGFYIRLIQRGKYEGNKLRFEDLKNYGFIPPQGPQKINNEKMLKYIRRVFEEVTNE